jgi:MoxR-like ATPase
MQVKESLLSSSNRPIIIDGIFGIGKTSLAADVAQELHENQRHVFWLHFGADFQTHHSDYATKVLAKQRELYQQIMGVDAPVCALQVVCIPVQNQRHNLQLSACYHQ